MNYIKEYKGEHDKDYLNLIDLIEVLEFKIKHTKEKNRVVISIPRNGKVDLYPLFNDFIKVSEFSTDYINPTNIKMQFIKKIDNPLLNRISQLTSYKLVNFNANEWSVYLIFTSSD